MHAIDTAPPAPAAAHARADHWNWRSYAAEAAGLGIFMIIAGLTAALLDHPRSPAAAIPPGLARRAVAGAVMGATAVALVKSPIGRASGAHMNPALTWTFYCMGRVAPRDLAGYVAAQCAGGAAGILLLSAVLGAALPAPAVWTAATTPGSAGAAAAFAAEAAISAILMIVILSTSGRARTARWTPWACGVCVAMFILIEAPWSGMSMNPARTLASALASGDWRGFWVYCTAPPLGMAAGAVCVRAAGAVRKVHCAALIHDARGRCAFGCGA